MAVDFIKRGLAEQDTRFRALLRLACARHGIDPQDRDATGKLLFAVLPLAYAAFADPPASGRPRKISDADIRRIERRPARS